MGKRLLQVSGEFMVEMCKASDGQFRHRVVGNPLPEDARLARVMGGPSERMVTLVIESETWPVVKPYERLTPPTIIFECVTEEPEPTPPADGDVVTGNYRSLPHLPHPTPPAEGEGGQDD